jgi:hypothetical protein
MATSAYVKYGAFSFSGVNGYPVPSVSLKNNFERVKARDKPFKNLLYYPIFGTVDTRLSYEKMIQYTDSEFHENILTGPKGIDVPNLYKDFVDTYYWPKMLEMLKRKKKELKI